MKLFDQRIVQPAAWTEVELPVRSDGFVSQAAVSSAPWSNYRDAKDRIADYCNDDGIITKKNSENSAEMAPETIPIQACTDPLMTGFCARFLSPMIPSTK